MNTAFMSYYTSMAKLTKIANKQTMFLTHLLYRMEYSNELKMCVVDLRLAVKKDILKSIGSNGLNATRVASSYISELQSAGLIKSIGDCRYAIDPSSFSYGSYIPKELRDKTTAIYEKRSYTNNDIKIIETSVVLDDGEIVHITDIL